MDFKLVNRLLGKLTLAFCAVLVIPLLGALLNDGCIRGFANTFIGCFLCR